MPLLSTPPFGAKIAEKGIYLRSKRFWHIGITDKGTTIFSNNMLSEAKNAPF